MKEKNVSKKYVRKIFKIGNNGKTHSNAITIPKTFVDVLKIDNDDNNRLLVSLENENDDNSNYYIRIEKLDDNHNHHDPISQTTIQTNEIKNDIDDDNNKISKQGFESWD